MSTVVQEKPAVHIKKDLSPRKEEAMAKELMTSCVTIRITFPEPTCLIAPEMSDEELLQAAEATGTFKFLDSAEEDVYQP